MSSLNQNEQALLDFTVKDLLSSLHKEWPSHSISMAAFQHYIPNSPGGETVVQVQVRIVTDDTDFLPDFTKEVVNNHIPHP